MTTVDTLIVGAGTAGSILAARLSEDPARQVLLLEAGPDAARPGIAEEILRDCRVPGVTYDWGLTATACGGRDTHLPRGKVVGGSSQVNLAGAVRPPAADFDDWAALGLPAWRWDEVVSSFAALESDEQYADRPYHGADGPLPITRWADADLLPPMRGMLDAVRAAGHPYCPDLNAPDAYGIGPYPQNRRGTLRVSTALAYLEPARSRTNLTVRGDTNVDRIVVDGDRAVGVEAGGETIRAREVVVCAGAPYSPALLLRSGIGPSDDLRALGIAPVHDLPGVGRELIDQPGLALFIVPTPAAAEASAEGPTLQTLARLAAFPGHAADHAFYLCLFVGHPTLARLTGIPPLSMLQIGDMRMASRGSLTLTSADPAVPPAVDLGFYTADGDLDRMMAAVRAAWDIVNRAEFTPFVESYVEIDDSVVSDNERLREMVLGTTSNRANLLGGCTMGTGDRAVVDERCRVRGLSGLRVVDASVVPVPLRAPAALTCAMLGEHTARWLTG